MKKIFIALLFCLSCSSAHAQFGPILQWVAGKAAQRQIAKDKLIYGDPARIDETTKIHILKEFQNEYGYLGVISIWIKPQQEFKSRLFEYSSEQNPNDLVFTDSRVRVFVGGAVVKSEKTMVSIPFTARRIWQVKRAHETRQTNGNLTNEQLKAKNVEPFPMEKPKGFSHLVGEVPYDNLLGGNSQNDSYVLVEFSDTILPEKISLRIVPKIGFSSYGEDIAEPTRNYTSEAIKLALKEFRDEPEWSYDSLENLPTERVVLFQNGKIVSGKSMRPDVMVTFASYMNSYRTATRLDFSVIPSSKLVKFINIANFKELLLSKENASTILGYVDFMNYNANAKPFVIDFPPD